MDETSAPTPVRSWSTPASDPNEEPHVTTLWSDGSMTCSPCKGFFYSRDGKPKSCKHTRRHQKELANAQRA